MLRIKDLRVSAELKKVWEDAIAPIADAALADFRTWPLYQRVGEPWPDAPSRFVRAASLGAVVKGLKSDRTSVLEEAAHPGLRAMYFNLSTVLNIRFQYFNKAWNRAQAVVWKDTRAALAAMTKRLKWKPGEKEVGYWLYRPNVHLWRHVWEQLHPQAVEGPFQEHFLTIFRAGHVPAGLQEDDWKTCRFLYF
jgi:hypothetical protein